MDSIRVGSTLALIMTLLILSLVTVACRTEETDIASTATAPAPAAPTTATDEQAPAPAESEPAGETYPPPLEATATGGPYPPPTPTYIPVNPYPTEGEAEEPTGILLALERPLHPGDTTVRGVGPAGISVIVRDITDMGVVLGQVIIGEDGTFRLEVEPLPEGIRVGLTTGDADTVAEGIRPGEGAISVPQVGYFYDSIMVRQEQ